MIKFKQLFIACSIFAVKVTNGQLTPGKDKIKSAQSHILINNTNTFSLSSASIIPENFYSKNLGLMCQFEKKFENAIKLPVKFRLGSVRDADYLEGKKIPVTIK